MSSNRDCSVGVSSSDLCTVSVIFKPSAAGSRSGSVTITDNATGSPHIVSLTGTGVSPQVTLSASSLSFANQLVSTTSVAQTITVSNSGSAALSITSVAITGTNAADFSQTNTCGVSVAAGASCTVSATFTPSAAGSRSGSVVITDNATGSPHIVSLTGTGVAPQVTLSASSLSFARDRKSVV